VWIPPTFLSELGFSGQPGLPRCRWLEAAFARRLADEDGGFVDYNWPFSSVAQSIAALVGVLGAFLISRILTNEAAAFEGNRSKTHELLRHSQTPADRAGMRYFEWSSERSVERELSRIQSEIEDGNALEDAESYYLHYGLSSVFASIGSHRTDSTGAG